jgi:transcriptional regulator of acetoin/glycerol metabolism
VLDTASPAPPPAVATVASAAPTAVPVEANGHAPPPESSPSAALREAECAALLRELERMRWNISRTAQTLGISRNTLYRKIHKHRILLEH